MTKLTCITLLLLLAAATVGEHPIVHDDGDDGWYDYRTSEAWAALDATQRERIETVTRDFVLLWGALDMYADEHGGRPPESLDHLVPRYLRELPVDPFATDETSKEPTPGYVPSRNGRGYLYRRGAEGNRAWCLASAGLPEFPYLAERGNIGLYICKGVWISGINPMRVDE
jgi:hypothetical protein